MIKLTKMDDGKFLLYSENITHMQDNTWFEDKFYYEDEVVPYFKWWSRTRQVCKRGVIKRTATLITFKVHEHIDCINVKETVDEILLQMRLKNV